VGELGTRGFWAADPGDRARLWNLAALIPQGHPIADLHRGSDRARPELDRKGVYPPVRVLPSLSRLMKDGIGEGATHADHPALAQQLYASYARAVNVRTLASVVGTEGLPPVDRKFLAFADEFERKLVHQDDARTLDESMRAGWQILRALPARELTRLRRKQIADYLERG
jgi:V/A-type H+-transporting ATPase subunit B